jgi:DNA-binding response OmpR family regulator
MLEECVKIPLRTIDVHVGKLRQKIENDPANPSCILAMS